MTIEIFGIDLGKSIRSIVGLDDTGKVVLRRRVRRYRLLNFLFFKAGLSGESTRVMPAPDGRQFTR
jgi:hypothetical protein